jgi:hypothetical protein
MFMSFYLCFLLYLHFLLRIVELKITKVLAKHYYGLYNPDTFAKY